MCAPTPKTSTSPRRCVPECLQERVKADAVREQRSINGQIRFIIGEYYRITDAARLEAVGYFQ